VTIHSTEVSGLAPQSQTVAAAMSIPDGPWTERDLARLPGDGHRYEIVDGALVVTPPADDGHEMLCREVADALRGAAPPDWRVVVGAPLRIGDHNGDSNLVADVAVLRPGAPADRAWIDGGEVALTVEIESHPSRRWDRCVKPGLYAEAGVESFWRIERTANGPVAHLYTRAAAGHYQLHRSVNTGETHLAELPYAVQLAPASWLHG
jgi:Uma2 family endonuclease